mmetsp:Transcript_19344/g.28214  ORF Transcript_19344/g.28214 Transcript_19344/m.28214 type:complete len:304 (+) Transcript_19344:196-1107(+)
MALTTHIWRRIMISFITTSILMDDGTELTMFKPEPFHYIVEDRDVLDPFCHVDQLRHIFSQFSSQMGEIVIHFLYHFLGILFILFMPVILIAIAIAIAIFYSLVLVLVLALMLLPWICKCGINRSRLTINVRPYIDDDPRTWKVLFQKGSRSLDIPCFLVIPYRLDTQYQILIMFSCRRFIRNIILLLHDQRWRVHGMNDLLYGATHGLGHNRIVDQGSLGPIKVLFEEGWAFLAFKIGNEFGGDIEYVVVLAREPDVGEVVEHFEEAGGARAAGGEDEEVASVAGGAHGGVLALGVGGTMSP